MTNVWIMRKMKGKDNRSVLVRADAITYLSGDDREVRASELGSDEVVVLADDMDGGRNAPLLPPDFHTDLIYAITQTRKNVRDATDAPDQEDRILMAQVEDDCWVWKEFRPSEPSPKPTA